MIINNEFNVILQDENDQQPVFSQDFYEAVIAENTPGGSTVITTPATDGDSTYPNNDIIYRIDTGAKDKFGMDAGTGRITVTNGADLDRDVYGTRYTLTVSEKFLVYFDILAFLQLNFVFVH